MDTRAIVEDLLAVVPDLINEFDGLSGATAVDLELWLPTIPTSAGLVAILDNEISRPAAVALARRTGVPVPNNETRTRALEMWLEGRGAPPTRPLLCAQLLATHIVEAGLQGTASPDAAYGISKSLAPETERLARAVARYYLDRCGPASDRVLRLQEAMNKQLVARLRDAFEQVAADGDVDRILEVISFGTIGSLVKLLLVRRSSTNIADDDAKIDHNTALFEELASLRNPVCHGRATSEQGHRFCQVVSSSLVTWQRCRVIPRGALVREVKSGAFGILAIAEDEHGKQVELSGGLAWDAVSSGDSLLIEPNRDKILLNGAGLRPLPKEGTWCSPKIDVTSDPIDLS